MAWVSSVCFFSFSNAQVPPGVESLSTPNLVQPYGWQGCLTQHQGWIWGGNSGGPCPVQRSGDGAILFSFGQQTLSQTFAVNQALSGTGIRITGYNYSWTIKNANAGSGQTPASDPLRFDVKLYDSNNKNVESFSHDYSQRINDWTTFAGSQNFNNIYSLADVSNVTLSMTGRDAGNWAGYYAAEVNNVRFSLRYHVDVCASDPLSSPSCPGYAEAFKQQQCTQNPLFSPDCPGYASAYLQQQCTVNALFNPSCPGYAQAFYDEQCKVSALYDKSCPGYAQAYFLEQCRMNPLHDRTCAGYDQAFFNQQCSLNALYNAQCPGYAQAFYNEQCRINALYDRGCPNYEAAFLAQQCSLNTLYNPLCPGYAGAYQQKVFNDACSANPQSSPKCPNYKAPEVAETPTIATPAQEVAGAPSQVAVVSDPFVNQTISPPSEQTIRNREPLGQGLLVPGFNTSAPQQPSRATARETARRDAVQSGTRAQQETLSNEQRQQIETLTKIASVPGFDAYQTTVIPDAPFYQARDIYRGVIIRDNVRAQRALSQRSDRIHQEMINEQYRK